MMSMDKRIPVSVFEAAAEKHADAIAVEAPDGTLTYSGLDRAANAIAFALQLDGINTGELAAVFIPNSAAYISAVIGIQKACGVFMPADPNAPLDRQARMFSKASPSVVITDEERLPQFQLFAERSGYKPRSLMVVAPDGPVKMYRNDGSADTIPVSETELQRTLPGTEDDLYVLFTSGTTGDPKAVLGMQKSLAHFLNWERREFQLDETVHASNLAPTTFDVSLRDIFVPLTAGGCVSVPHESVRTSPSALLDWLSDRKINLVHIVPSVFRLLLDELEKRQYAKSLMSNMRHIMLAGEAVYGRDVIRFRNIADDAVQLVNLYGPSETTLAKLFHRMDYIPENPSRIMPLGQPISNTAALIIKQGRLAEIGEIGEIYIKTPFRSKGYFRDPELTAEAFIANPLTGDPDDIVYRTGDMGRYMNDRSVEFAGRLDRQVKVNGVRVELSEVDEAVSSFDGIKQALVMPHSRRDGEISLICYYTEERHIETESLRDYLSQSLYSAMIPSFFVRLDTFPLGINGKIDRRALPRPDDLIYEGAEFVSPETDTEIRIASVWSEILGIGKISAVMSFSALGGGSMQAIRCLGGISRAFGVELSLREFFDNATVRSLGYLIESKITESRTIPIPRQPERPDYPATHSQKRLWMLQKMIPGFTAFNITGCFRVNGNFDENAFEASLRTVLQRHDILRTVFFERDGELRQRVLPKPVFHLERLGKARTEGEANEIAERFSGIVFDLEQGPMIRAGVIEDRDGKLLVFAIHHIICDAWSLDIILRETLELYRGTVNGSVMQLPEPALQYRDFASWHNTRLEQGEFDSQRSYWLDRLKGELPRLELPLDAPRPSRRNYRGSSYSVKYSDEILAKLREYAESRNCTLFPVLLAGLRALLFRYTGQTETILNSPVTLRGRQELETLPGDFTNTILFRGTVTADTQFSVMTSDAAYEIDNAMANRDYPFDLIVTELDVTNDLSRAPVSDVGITLVEDYGGHDTLNNGLILEPYDTEAGISKYDMVFHFSLSSGHLGLNIEYDSVIFSHGRVMRMAANFGALLGHAVSLPDTAVSDLDLIDPEEQALIKRFQFPRPRNYPDTTIHDAFRGVAAEQPDACALVLHDGTTVTYENLDRSSSRIASMLMTGGYSSGTRVAVHMRRGPDVPAVILGILKSGCVYVPIPDDLPRQRIDYMLQDSGAAVAIVDENTGSNLPDAMTRLEIGTAQEYPDAMPQITVNPEDEAYIIYTSGSTGLPKGVLLPHLGLVNRARDLAERISITSRDRFTQFASLSFDASMYEMFCALLNGASLVFVDRKTIEDTDAFVALLERCGVTFTLLPPTYLRSLERRKLADVRVLKTAGEAADTGDALHYSREIQYLNGYGPTEDSICSAIFTVDPSREYPLGIPIGDPVGDTEALVLDNHLKPLPIGVPGQLCVSDRGLAIGYINKPELTAKSFVQHPYDPSRRMYLTGDLVQWEEDGCLLFLGRIDDQVKIGGHRIEPGEIETVMRTIAGVADAHVIPTGEGSERRLAAYYTGAADEKSIRAQLSEALPRYMVPHFFMHMESMPLTASGKIDRHALPNPESRVAQSGQEAATEEETVLLDVIRDVTGNRTLGVDANFFAVGGDSIRAIQAVSRLRENEWVLTAADFFESPIISDLALFMRRGKGTISQEPASGIVKPTPILVWFTRNVVARPEHFNQSVLLKSDSDIDFLALSTAAQSVWKHHDALRMVYTEGVFTILPDDTPSKAEYVDLRCETDHAGALAEYAGKMQKDFILESGPLFKVVQFRCGDGDRILLLAHHLVVDAVTWHILIRDMEIAYTASLKGDFARLPEKTNSYCDWAEMLHKKAEAGDFDGELSYWKNITAAPCDSLTQIENEGAITTLTARIALAEIDGLIDENAANEPLARMLAALASTLHQWKGTSNTRIMLEGHGRGLDVGGVDISRTAGWFTAAYPFLLDCKPDIGTSFDSAMTSLKNIPSGGIGYGVLRFVKGHDELDTPVDISFNYLGRLDSPESMFALSDEPTGETVSPENSMGYALEFLVAAEEDTLEINFSYDSILINTSDAEQLLALYTEYLKQAAKFRASTFDFSDFGEGGLDAFLDGI